MSNAYLVRAEDVRIITDRTGEFLTVPDLRIPGSHGIDWDAFSVSDDAFMFWVSRNGRKIRSLWHGPHTIGGQKLFFVSVNGSDKALLVALKNQLGDSNCAPLIQVLRLQNTKGAAVRNYVKAQPWFSPVRNSSGRIIGLHAPMVLAGRTDPDLDGDDPDAAEVLPDLEVSR